MDESTDAIRWNWLFDGFGISFEENPCFNAEIRLLKSVFFSIKSALAKPFAKRVYNKTLKWVNNPIKTQEKVFQELISSATSTQFGSDHDFISINNHKKGLYFSLLLTVQVIFTHLLIISFITDILLFFINCASSEFSHKIEMIFNIFQHKFSTKYT